MYINRNPRLFKTDGRVRAYMTVWALWGRSVKSW